MTNLIRSNDDANFPWLGALIGSAIIGFWYWCTDQFIVQRVLSGKNEKEARRGTIFGAYLKLLPVFLFLIPGMIAFALHQKISRNRGRRFSTYAGKRKCQCRCCFPNSSSKIASCRSQRFGCLRYSCSIDEFSRIFVQLICYAFTPLTSTNVSSRTLLKKSW